MSNAEANGYVGWCSSKEEGDLHVLLLFRCGLKAWRKGRYSIFTKPGADCLRAREIRRGFRIGLKLKGDPVDFVLGVRAALNMKLVKRKRLKEAGIENRQLEEG